MDTSFFDAAMLGALSLAAIILSMWALVKSVYWVMEVNADRKEHRARLDSLSRNMNNLRALGWFDRMAQKEVGNNESST